MKSLIIINGAMGVGKTEISKNLYKKLNNSVWLDGDWCWMMNPFEPNETNKKMVIENINFLLKNFLENPNVEYVIFNWVIHLEEIYDLFLNELKKVEFELRKFTLICSEEELIRRVTKDFEENGRIDRKVRNCVERLRMYQNMNTIKIDTTNISIDEATNKILKYLDK